MRPRKLTSINNSGVDGLSDFNGLQSPKQDDEVMLYAFDILALDGEDLRKLPLGLRKTNLARLLARRPEGMLVSGEIGPDLFRAACRTGSTAWFVSAVTGSIGATGRRIGLRSKTRSTRRCKGQGGSIRMEWLRPMTNTKITLGECRPRGLHGTSGGTCKPKHSTK
jgi:hypothetical protein